MTNISPDVTKGKVNNKSWILLCFTLAFIVLLSFFTVNKLSPLTPERIIGCENTIETLQTKLETETDQEAVEKIKEKIKDKSDEIIMLQNREEIYIIAIVIVVAMLVMGYAYQMAVKTGFMAPLAALSILLTIGFSFRAIVWFDRNDCLFFLLSVFASMVTYLLFRRMLKMNNIFYGLLIGGVIGLLFLNLVFGVTINGAKNWVYLAGLSIQPGELIKFLLVIIGAYSYQSQIRVFVYYVMSMISTVTFVYLGDIGTAMIFFVLALMMTLLLLDNPKLFVAFTLLAVVALVAAFLLFSHARARLENWGSAMDNSTGQQASVIRSILFGGLGGLGIENSSHILSIYSIDSDVIIGGITAVFGVGMLFITMMCYAILVLIPRQNVAVYPWSYYIVAQASIIITVQVLLNFLGSVDVLPFTGIVAPFLSSGGSSSVTFFMLFGVMMASLNPKVNPLIKEQKTAKVAR